MAAALTIAILLALSVTLVRIAAVAMRLTGLPQNIARFQCISALTGTGFTTHESEMIVNYPVRRRILVTLMIVGNLGLVSLAGTFIVAFVNTGTDTGAIVWQILAIALALFVTLLVTTNRTLDRLLCAMVARVLTWTTYLGKRRYQRILQLDHGFSVAEHILPGKNERSVTDLALDAASLTLLAIRSQDANQYDEIAGDLIVFPGDTLVYYGSDSAHETFEELQTGPDADVAGD